MTKTIFSTQLAMLNKYYINFKFDINDDMMVRVWYEALKQFDDETFKLIIMEYCTNNIYPPQSPTHLIEHYKLNIVKSELCGEQAFEMMLSDIKKDTWAYYYTRDQYLQSGNFSKIAIAHSIMELDSEIETMRYDSNSVQFVKKQFVTIYEKNLINQVSKVIFKQRLKEIE